MSDKGDGSGRPPPVGVDKGAMKDSVGRAAGRAARSKGAAVRIRTPRRGSQGASRRQGRA